MCITLNLGYNNAEVNFKWVDAPSKTNFTRKYFKPFAKKQESIQNILGCVGTFSLFLIL